MNTIPAWVDSLSQLLTAIGLFGTMILAWRSHREVKDVKTIVKNVEVATNGVKKKLEDAFDAGVAQGRMER